MNEYYRASIWKRPSGGYDVWVCSTLTGDRKELLDSEVRKATALKIARLFNAKATGDAK